MYRRKKMKRIIVAIGGGENGRLLKNGVYASYDTEKIDKEIVSLTNKKNPNYYLQVMPCFLTLVLKKVIIKQ